MTAQLHRFSDAVPAHAGEPRRLSRLALFTGNYNTVVDGPAKALNRLVAFLKARDVDVRIFAPQVAEPAFAATGTVENIPSIPIPGRSEYRVPLGLPRAQRRALRDFAPDLLHLASPDPLGRAALKWAQGMGLPRVASFHTRFDTYPRYYGMPWLEPMVSAYMRRFYGRCDEVYVPSDSMAEELRAQGLSRLALWSRGVDRSIFTPEARSFQWRRSLGVRDDSHVIAFVGRLVLEKGLGVFRDVIRTLQARGLPVQPLIVGEGPERARLQEQLPDAIFTGFLDGAALGRAYASSDIFFNASVTETFGNVTLEAMASGCVPVCANATGSRTLVTHDENGLLVDGQNVAGFADAIACLIRNPDERAAMAAASLEKAAPYAWDQVLASLLDRYEAVLKASHRHTAAPGATTDPARRAG
ncbi:glycosyltransferase family 4 protein [Yunchengibacter salinarum]|uniref:glycosyltransferase family 4 protein n=1 Tax=Yunchengibacter salinarum TaxID=3133399 RepID=UPI0035B61EE9